MNIPERFLHPYHSVSRILLHIDPQTGRRAWTLKFPFLSSIRAMILDEDQLRMISTAVLRVE